MLKKLLDFALMFPLLCGTSAVNSSVWRWRKDTDDKIKAVGLILCGLN